MTEYTIINEMDENSIEKAVNRFIKEEWECKGGISVFIDQDGDVHYHQAMIRTLPETNTGTDYNRPKPPSY